MDPGQTLLTEGKRPEEVRKEKPSTETLEMEVMVQLTRSAFVAVDGTCVNKRGCAASGDMCSVSNCARENRNSLEHSSGRYSVASPPSKPKYK